jgi:Cys-tRNA(Pro)/Cys-tRNA(Cys) deacylase
VPVKDLQNLTGYIRGGVSPLAMKKNYPVFLDKEALALDFISLSAGKRGLQIFFKPADLQRVTGATVVAVSRDKSGGE